jgi:hypothetical protein
VLAQEHRIYPLAVRWFAEGRLVRNHGRVNLKDDPASQSCSPLKCRVLPFGVESARGGCPGGSPQQMSLVYDPTAMAKARPGDRHLHP